MTVVTRFAPSPTGFLHIGGARTALFNWLYAKHTGGKFLLRIEDTDRERSTPEATQAIIDGLTWLELDWDGDVVYQSKNIERHAEAARRLLAEGKAYYCYCTPEQLAAMREEARRQGKPPRYNGYWRDRDPAEAPKGVPPVIRLKAPTEGETVIQDLIQGEVRVGNDQLDDMILLRANGTPTYMLSVVVDDHDMAITHVIRGDDHLTNAFRQTQLFRALGWKTPYFAHVPLIHGSDGAKLSKRHGALGVDAYRDMGFLPAALRNYLLRLGWGHGDAEIISTEQAIAWFDLPAVGRAAARFDMAKLENLNGHYIRETADDALLARLLPFVEKRLGHAVDAAGRARLVRAMAGLKARAKTLVELADNALFYLRAAPLPMTDKAQALLTPEARAMLRTMRQRLAAAPAWTQADLEEIVRLFAEASTPPLKLGMVAQPLRAALTGSTMSPGIFEVLEILGSDEALRRLDAVANQ
ncbi:MAG TPA: glutamate--tRNA ligase [Alphaproteobacteria bacterium]|nr:glutamate--tRNA ligase [Alphaproteobacteria bacterium]